MLPGFSRNRKDRSESRFLGTELPELMVHRFLWTFLRNSLRMADHQLLLVSQSQTLIHSIKEVAAERGASLEIVKFETLQDDRQGVDVMLLHLVDEQDFRFADRALREASASEPRVPIAIILEKSDPRRELALLDAGALEVFTRPLVLNRVAFAINSVLLASEFRAKARESRLRDSPRRAKARRESLSLAELRNQAFAQGILFRSRKMLQLMEYLRHVIGRDSNILISGETGTGKTRLAKLIHNLSPRRDEPFVVANCAAITPSLLESELFGHAKGAFTGATDSRDGKFHAAGAGTLFLDEIDSLPPSGQQRLLHVLDQRVFEKVGSNEPEILRARVIAAANRPLERLVADGQFRADLYYRLKVVTVDLPALRERPEDIEPIALHLLREEAEREGEDLPGMAQEIMDRLTQHDWPGNIRELRNVISQMVVFAEDGALSLAPLPEASLLTRLATPQSVSDSTSPRPRFSPMETEIPVDPVFCDDDDSALPSGHTSAPQMRPLQWERIQSESKRILRELRLHNHNRTKTAQSLGISRNALYKRLKKLDLVGVH